MFDLTGRTALVTGAGQGVGRGIALTLAAQGAAVAINDFFRERADAVAAEITAAGGRAVGLQADVTDLTSVTGAVAEAEEQLGAGVDLLVNNAGNAGPSHNIDDPTPFWETGPEDWAPWMATNYYGVLNCARAVLPGMVERGHGRIVSIVSDAGRVGEPNLVVYSGAKAGAAGFTRGLAKAIGRHGITANCVALATMRTPATEPLLADADLARRALKPYVVRRFGEPSDAAAAVLFLVSDEASWVTAQTYPVNGGYSVST
ncbi:3-oxoacyl-[acyl-carrier-protein] reductase FabG [Paraconexibacter sp. AEG42_29]|uniref:3-oxoacyl-[acyl-carrier-protein] reductase FabG n=1 Tax=Paraconexibacter sp. AEG42_29 TaxID=2997339 RepID=A0AAU7ATT0_9ACTN